MDTHEPIQLQKLVSHQRRPASGDIFRVRLISGVYYFGLVVDGNMEVGPMAPDSILSIVFKDSSNSGLLESVDQLQYDTLLMPPHITNQRPWTTGYAEKIGSTDRLSKMNFVFKDFGFGAFVDRFGHQVEPPTDGDLVGVWGVGNEWTMSEAITEAISD